jgi:hypothetical protein
MKTTHTPAPWQLSNATSAGRFIGSGPDGVLGIAMAFGDSPDEQDANARLIAAAPDLQAQLKIANDNLSLLHSEWKEGHSSSIETCSCTIGTNWRSNKAAMAKTEGVQ